MKREEIKILCISDIHGNRKLAEKILLNEEYHIAISAGDTELDDAWVNKYFQVAVAGNNDFSSSLPDEQTFNIKNFTLHVAHGHTYGNYSDLMNQKKMLNATSDLNTVDLFVSGHTHCPLYFPKEENNKAFLNPGSITYPRFGSLPSYALITADMTSGEIIEVLFKNPKHLKEKNE